ncbi:MAG: multiheme c-type cytochrome [Xanthomonadales bacterium]|nr:multiheme c-type cytochrome [Xanthomonadales bacterium]
MRWLAIGFLASTTLAAHAATPPYAGTQSCAGCHEPEYAAWKTSHHYQAMRPATDETVLGDFGDTTFEYGNVTSRFFRRDGKFLVETDGPDGKLQEFEIAYTFGFEPLQQYLVPFPDGRYQALNVVWDTRPAAAGGQRWVHLYSEDEGGAIGHDDRLHWTGSFQNWNARCAVCHSTGLEKNFAAAANRYRTEWQEIDVACEACHGPGAAHVQWAESDRAGDPDPHKGFAFSLTDRGSFGPPAPAPASSPARSMAARPANDVPRDTGIRIRPRSPGRGRSGSGDRTAHLPGALLPRRHHRPRVRGGPLRRGRRRGAPRAVPARRLWGRRVRAVP